MTRLLYDAVTWGNIPPDAEMVGGYVDGFYAWPAVAWAMFPQAVQVRIAVHPWTNDGNCLDIETGDAAPDDGPGWVTMRLSSGQIASVYFGDYIANQVIGAFDAAGMAQPPRWRAAYPGIGPYIYPGDVAHQYEGDSDQGWDRSVVVDAPGWAGVDVAGPAPTPSPEEDDDMPQTKAFVAHVTDVSGGPAIFCFEDAVLGHRSTWIRAGATIETLRGLGITVNGTYGDAVTSDIWNHWPLVPGQLNPVTGKVAAVGDGQTTAVPGMSGTQIGSVNLALDPVAIAAGITKGIKDL